jgi:hypothetical protein
MRPATPGKSALVLGRRISGRSGAGVRSLPLLFLHGSSCKVSENVSVLVYHLLGHMHLEEELRFFDVKIAMVLNHDPSLSLGLSTNRK